MNEGRLDLEPGDTVDVIRNGRTTQAIVLSLVLRNHYAFRPACTSTGAFLLTFRDGSTAHFDVEKGVRLDLIDSTDKEFILGLSEKPLKISELHKQGGPRAR